MTLKMEIEFRFGFVFLRDSGKTRTSSSDVGCGLNGKIKLRLKKVSEWREGLKILNGYVTFHLVKWGLPIREHSKVIYKTI